MAKRSLMCLSNAFTHGPHVYNEASSLLKGKFCFWCRIEKLGANTELDRAKGRCEHL